jgi:hypothetical protein
MLTVSENHVLTLEMFLVDLQGSKFRSVVASPGFAPSFQKALSILNEPACQERLKIAETYFHQPAISGAAHELEPLLKDVKFFASKILFNRFKQALGVAVRIFMEWMGWKKTSPAIEERVLVGTCLFKARRYTPPPTDMSLFPEQKKAIQVISMKLLYAK